GQNDWGVTYTSTHICALKGSTVVIHCTYRYPSRVNNHDTTVDETLWFSKLNNNEPVDLRTDSECASRVQYHCDKNDCSLRITDLRERDSAEYKFRFTTNRPGGKYTGSPGVTLTVTDLQVKVNYPSRCKIDPCVWAKLSCHSMCRLPDHHSYIWYKNGEIIQKNTDSLLDYFYDKDSFSCAVRGYEHYPAPSVYAPKLPSVSVSPSAEIVEGSSVNLTCSSDANPAANYTWYKENEDSPKASGQIFIITDVRPEHSGNYSCEAQNRRGRHNSTLHLTVVAVVQGQKAWGLTYNSTHICALKVSTVDMHCTYTYPPWMDGVLIEVRKTFWFTKLSNKKPLDLTEDSEYAGRVQYHCDGSSECTLTLTDLRHIDSAEYKFRLITNYSKGKLTGSPGVTLTVTVLVTPSGDIMEGSSVNLTCSSDANPAANYTWYKENVNPDLQPLSKEPQLVFSSIQSSDSGEYYCTAENQLGKNTSEYIIDVKYAPKLPSVSVSPSAEIVEGSSVTLTCSSDANPAANYTWYKENEDSPKASGQIFTITDVRPEHSGNYSCEAQNRRGRHNSTLHLNVVQDAPIVPSVLVTPSGDIMEGSSVNLTCSGDANISVNYTWYKKNVNQDLQPLSKEPQLVVNSIQSSDSGEYYCTTENQLGKSTSEYIFIDVKYAPKIPSVSVSPSGEIVEGTSVTLTCSSDANPAANYTWYKENQTLFHGSEGIYNFTSISSEDRAMYFCKSENQYGQINSSSFLIDVLYAPKILSVSVSPSGEIVEGSSVNLTCSSDANPAANYTWYKENQTLFHGSEGIYNFMSISSEDRAMYYCKSENQYGQINSSSFFINVLYAPKLPSVSVSPSGEIVEGSSVNLTCSSDANPAANYTWYKENEDSPKASGQILTITDVRPEHSGNYYCDVQNRIGRNRITIHLTVEDAPTSSSVSVSTSGEIEEGSSVTLTCSSDANPEANYTLYKSTGPKVISGGRQLVLKSIKSSDSGEYYCIAENELGKKTSGTTSINVKHARRMPSVSVSPSGEIIQGSSVTLTCSDDKPAANYTWYKNNVNPELQPLSKEPQFVFSSIQSSDSGEYYCTTESRMGKRASEYIFIDVKYAPKLPSVSVSPSGEIVEGSSVTLTCSSDVYTAVKYTWYKENEDSPKASGQTFTITDVRPEHSGNYYCEAQNRRRLHSATLHLTVVKDAYKMPFVSVSPSGEIIEGSSVTLTCSSDDKPESNYTWYKKNVNPDLQPLSTEPHFVFSSIQSSDSGEYYCTAVDQMGKRLSENISIDVK
ncbi:sialoadhesin-like, partial [Scomber scombrus]